MVTYDKQLKVIKEEQERNEMLHTLEHGFEVADVFINRQYLDDFENAIIINDEVDKVQACTKLRIFEMTKIVFDKDEDVLDKLTSIYNALYNLSVSVAIIIIGCPKNVKFYFATRSEQNAPLAGKIIESMLHSHFPGIELLQLNNAAIKDFMKDIETNQEGETVLKGLSTVSVVPDIRNHENKDKFVQGIEKIVNTLKGKSYSAILLATPLNNENVIIRKHGYEELYSTLSPYAKYTYSYGENISHAVNKGISNSFTKSVNESVTNSNSTTEGNSYTDTYGSSSSFGASGDGWGVNSGTSSSSASSYTSSTTFSHSISNSVGTAESEGTTKSDTDTTGNTKTHTVNYENKGISDLMKRIQEQIDRINVWESYGLWENCAYFFSDEISTAVLAATTYKALMIGEKSGIENAHINIWNSTKQYGIERIKSIMDCVKYLVHPKSEIVPLYNYQKQVVTPTSMVSGSELALLLGVPRKSLAGVAVQEMAEFGRTVVYESNIPQKQISIGNIYHMGIEEKQTPVNMNMDVFSSHCFITGSSGSGKSYATYKLLDELIENGIKMLVVEPAKGEYKTVFGKLSKVNIFTTDVNTYRMLRINPFKFPSNIHILSHIEQLMQIFNASWPLYAAMPSILKEAVVKAYIKCGWDVKNSKWINGISERKYPIFEDVLAILPDIINNSDYSSDSKGDYKGALLTRVQSMTTGINGVIFEQSEGIEEYILFDENTIIDLSEIGSEETIALIMGVLIMRLNEYRKSQRKEGVLEEHDNRFRHITVLEEAHNILKRTSKEQSQDGSNMVGKSVEMISNSIKEMRTYGEGFLIIDQSPLAVDNSVIENTATKIIMNTPSKAACEELGSALSLTNEQTKELSRLNVGVAAVIQKGWMMPVLMKVGIWDSKKYEASLQYENISAEKFIRSRLTIELCNQIELHQYRIIPFNNIIREADIEYYRKLELSEITEFYKKLIEKNKEPSNKMLGRLFLLITGADSLFDIVPTEGVYSDTELYEILEQINEEEKENLRKNILVNAQRWINIMEKSLDQYINVDNKNKRKALVYMLGVKGDFGENIKNKFGQLYNLLIWNQID